jgi:uncharacterized protein (TIGR02145 family)
MKPLIIFLLITNSLFAQWSNRTFRPYLDEFDRVIGVSVGHPEEPKIWLLEDIQVREDRNNLLDYKTQDSLRIIHVFLNPVVNRDLFNYSAATKVCPQGWRLPRVGEWDTLTHSITNEQMNFLFNRKRGFEGYVVGMNSDSTIVKNVQKLSGGYWWTSDFHNSRLIGMELTEYSVWREGYLLEGDFAAVRCVRDPE